jgi:hypothetical protein
MGFSPAYLAPAMAKTLKAERRGKVQGLKRLRKDS